MSNPTISFTGNATDLLANYKKLEDAQRKELELLKATKDAYKTAAQEERQQTADATKLKEANLSALEKHNRAVAKAGELLKANKITQAEYNAELKRQASILEESAGKVDGMAASVLGFGKDALSAFTGVGSAIAGVMAVASLVKSEYEDMKRRSADAFGAQVDFAGATRGIGVGFKPDASMGIDAIEPAVMGIMERTGATPAQASDAVKAALAGRGTLSNAQAFQMAELALGVDRNDQGLTRELATRGGLLSQAAGWTDPRKALSLFSDLQNAATVVNPRDVGQSGMASVTDLLTYGETPESGAELFATLNNLMNDTEGARTKTAIGALALQARDFKPLNAFATTSEKVAAMQRDSKLRKAFLDKSSFEIGATPAIEQLLSGSDAALATAADVRGKINDPSAEAFGEFVGGINAMGAQQLASAAAINESRRTTRRVKDLEGGASGAAFSEFDAALGDVDLPGFDAIERKVLSGRMGALVMTGTSPASAAATTLEEQISRGSQSFWAGGGMSQEHLAALRESVTYLRTLSTNSSGGPPENALGRPAR